jgi:hypothetical protein
MNIQPIVEGHGEVPAVPVLLRRLRDMCGAFGIEVNRPIRATRSQLIREDTLKQRVALALLQEDCGAILIIFDADDDCPLQIAPTIHAWANEQSQQVSSVIVMANREYEAWFLASIESLRGKWGIRNDAISHPNPEVPRAAKAQLEELMVEGTSYSETVDQAALTALFDIVPAYARCRSFRHLVTAFGSLITSLGHELIDWPPNAWRQEDG